MREGKGCYELMIGRKVKVEVGDGGSRTEFFLTSGPRLQHASSWRNCHALKCRYFDTRATKLMP